VGEPRETVWHTVMFDPDLQAFVFEKRRIAGTFVENLELYQFPFDTQVDGHKHYTLHSLLRFTMDLCIRYCVCD